MTTHPGQFDHTLITSENIFKTVYHIIGENIFKQLTEFLEQLEQNPIFLFDALFKTGKLVTDFYQKREDFQARYLLSHVNVTLFDHDIYQKDHSFVFPILIDHFQ
jgi:predicted butyrate kinase (DUF1464 family)